MLKGIEYFYGDFQCILIIRDNHSYGLGIRKNMHIHAARVKLQNSIRDVHAVFSNHTNNYKNKMGGYLILHQLKK